jgi:fumarylacetoacetase
VSANEPDTDFPIQNLPFCVFRRDAESPRVGVAIGDQIVDVFAAVSCDVFTGAALEAARACGEPTMNTLMSMGRAPARALRLQLSDWLSVDVADAMRAKLEPLLVRMHEAHLLLPATVGDYTDFYASVHHATNVGRMFRPDQPLLPNYKWVPIGYHGRASSVVVSGTPVKRPAGQRKAPAEDTPTVGPSRSLDYELELGAWVGKGNALGDTISIDEAEAHLFGVCLLNDWSARDLQSWEYQPLGPFLAKNFASTVSPFVVTFDALEPFRAPLAPRDASDPEPLPYLSGELDRTRGGLRLTLDVWLRTARMRDEGHDAVRISRGSALDLYWSFAQMLTHHASNGCNMRAGDLIGSGTVSGPQPGSQGCLLEITKRAAEPIVLPNGESRGFLENGDEVVFRAFAEREGAVRIGFGACAGVVIGKS